jgi:hypothetical protein
MRNALGIALLLAAPCVTAQTVTADLDTSILRIGEQATITLTFSAAAPLPASVAWPVVGDTLTRHVEVVRSSDLDTLTDGSEVLLRQHIIITSFDSGLWAIPPFAITADGTVFESKALLVDIRTVEVDPAQGPHPLKPYYVLPFSLWSWILAHRTPIGLGLLALAVLAGVLVYLSRKRPTPVTGPVAAPVEPIDVRFTRALKDVEAQRLWQQGEHKAYHSRVTDLVRGYIEERFHVPALESTTDELLHELRLSALPADERVQLENMLRASDLVKFAKATPTPAENEQLMLGSLRFITATAPNTTDRSHEA